MADRAGKTVGQDAFEVTTEVASQDSGIAHRQMRARIKSKLFGVPPAPIRLGRFVILDSIGSGGMGVVYSAYDPELDRRVALKLLAAWQGRESSRAKDRLLREAQALARLSHPNVVPIYDVGVIDHQVFIVMEFVEGQTMRDWLAAKPRSWRQIWRAYEQAGRGLAAAHAADMVHRDFKPDNVQVGHDERIRVLDFGLARGGPSDEEEILGDSGVSLETSGRLSVTLTGAGALLGTPAYMSPEQFANADVGPKSDQFSFCLSLYEGLYGQRAFAGDSADEVRESVSTGEVRPPPRNSGVPGRFYPILCRGLSRDPGDRYPSMDALLAALGRDPARARRPWLLGLAAIGCVAVLVYSFMTARSEAVDLCAGAESKLNGIWDPDRWAVVERALMSTGAAYAERAWPRVADGLDHYARSWVHMHRDACVAHQRGGQSAVLLDKRMSCLERRLVALESAVSVLAETDLASLNNTVEVVQKLPPLDYCGNADALAAEVPPPEDPDVAVKIADLGRRLSRVRALQDAGRYPAAAELAGSIVAEAEVLGYRPFLAEALLAQGRAVLSREEREQAVKILRRATNLGLAAGTHEVGLEALARRIYAQGTVEKPEVMLALLPIAEALIEPLPEPTFVHALLLNNAGVVHLASGDRERALEYFTRALDVQRRTPDKSHIELAAVKLNLALVTAEPEARDRLLQAAIEDSDGKLGAAHPQTLLWHRVRGYYTLDPVKARSILTPTCTLYTRYHPELPRELSDCLYYLGFLHAELGDRGRAAEHLRRAAAILPDGPEPWWRDLVMGYSQLYGGDAAAAEVSLERVVATLAADSGAWWKEKREAEARLALGMSQLERGRTGPAAENLETALAIFSRMEEMNRKPETQQRLARTLVALATALWDGRGEPQRRAASPRDRVRRAEARGRAHRLVDRAEALYRQAPAGFARHLREIAAWRAVRTIGPGPP